MILKSIPPQIISSINDLKLTTYNCIASCVLSKKVWLVASLGLVILINHLNQSNHLNGLENKLVSQQLNQESCWTNRTLTAEYRFNMEQEICPKIEAITDPYFREIELVKAPIAEQVFNAMQQSGHCQSTPWGMSLGLIVINALADSIAVVKKNTTVWTEKMARDLLGKYYNELVPELGILNYDPETGLGTLGTKLIKKVQPLLLNYRESNSNSSDSIKSLEKKDRSYIEKRWVISILDILMSNNDRHLKNILYSKETSLMAIDHDLAFDKAKQAMIVAFSSILEKSLMPNKVYDWIKNHLLKNLESIFKKYQKFAFASNEASYESYLKSCLDLMNKWITGAQKNSFIEAVIELPRELGWKMISFKGVESPTNEVGSNTHS